MGSILKDIRKLLGISDNYNHFDQDLIIHINSVFDGLKHIGICNGTYTITGEDETWEDLFSDSEFLNIIKTYTYLKVKMIFDPPAGAAAESYKNLISEYEWRISSGSYED